jgi:beta-galactosidase GanA
VRQLLTSEYLPFGTQYYRAPSPRESEWDTDLRNIARVGFNTVKFWVQWRWNNPAEGKFYFDDIDRLMDLAGKYKLRVMLNTIFDVAPAWIYQKYPDAVMITLDGRRIGPQTQPHRQIGGLGLCLNHPDARVYFFEFLRQTVRRYSDHPALEMWNVGSEPELTQSMAELRTYADDAAAMGDMLCYCEHCQRAFKRWLKTKYPSIDALNTAWNRNYASFSDVEVPRTRNTFNDLIDWRMFFVQTLGENVKRRFEVAREEDRGRHPLLCHHVFIQGFPITSTASDPWNVGQYGDLHGFTQMDDAMMPDVLRSCAKGKPVISAEMLMLFGYTLDVPKPITLNDIKRYIFTGVAANLKGFIFWQYRPEFLGREAPAWGLTNLDGTQTPWLQSFATVNRVLQKNASFLLEARSTPAKVAILYNPENQIFAWAATGNEKTATDSLRGIHRALYEKNFAVDFIHPKEFPSILTDYRVLIVPFPYYLSASMCGAMEAWVRGGGVLIGESYFGGWNAECGQHNMIVPGYGLHRVFKARQGVVAPADEDGMVTLSTTIDLPHLSKGAEVVGAIVEERLVPEGADVLAKFASGHPAITSARHGDGRAILIGSYIGLAYHRGGSPTNGDLITSLVDANAAIERPRVAGGSAIRVDVLSNRRKEAMIILRNLEDRSVDDTISVPGVFGRSMVEQCTGERVTVLRKQRRSEFAVSMQAGEVKVYRV